MLLIFSPVKIMAQGNLMITPRRVILEGQKRTEELNLANAGKDTARYLISMMEIRMKNDGTFEKITQPDSGQNFASTHIRFFPRSVILAPGEAQAIKIQVTKPAELQTGEYRSHMYFRAVPDETPLGEATPVKDSSAISVRLVPIFGISIPVIVRVGECAAHVNISDVSLETPRDSAAGLRMMFNRSGNMSVYGDIKIDFISTQGKIIQAGTVKGVAVYTPASSRLIRINLDKIPGINYHSGKLHIIYTTPTDDKPVKIAETELVLH